MRLLLCKMRDVEEQFRPRLRELTEPEVEVMSRWIYQTGECYAALVFEGHSDELDPDELVAWACLTWEDGPYPYLGAYTDEDYRKKGYGGVAVRALLQSLSRAVEDGGSIVYADTIRWPAYREMIRRSGFACRVWEWASAVVE